VVAAAAAVAAAAETGFVVFPLAIGLLEGLMLVVTGGRPSRCRWISIIRSLIIVSVWYCEVV